MLPVAIIIAPELDKIEILNRRLFNYCLAFRFNVSHESKLDPDEGGPPLRPGQELQLVLYLLNLPTPTLNNQKFGTLNKSIIDFYQSVK